LSAPGVEVIHFDASMGVMESDVNREARIVTTMVMAKTLKKTPVRPETKMSGMKTTAMVKVDAVTAIPISLAPKMALAFGLPPRSICLTMFSRITMASSTTIPTATVRDMSRTMLMVKSKR